MNQPGLVVCQACGGPVSSAAQACPRCGNPMPWVAAAATARSNNAAIWLGVLLAISGLAIWRGCASFSDHSKKADAEFCKEWLGYYESLCTTNPDRCKEGPRKLARCDP